MAATGGIPARYTAAKKDRFVVSMGVSDTSFAYESTIKRWPTILAQVVDYLYRECHRISKEGENDAKVAEGKKIIEGISNLRYQLSHDRPLTELDVTENNAAAFGGDFRAPTTAAYDVYIRERRPTWMDSEWLFAECYLYRLLQKQFETSSHWQQFDPFADTKGNAFKASGAAIAASATLIDELVAQRERGESESEHSPAGSRVMFDELMSSSLWGNATDLSLLTSLSYKDLQKLQASSKEQRKSKGQYIIANELGAAWEKLCLLHEGRVDIVLDNAGFELVTDLLLADWLLTLRGGVPRITEEHCADICRRVEQVRARVQQAHAGAAGDAPPPELLAVSKLQPPSVVLAAYERTGQRDFGENYVQELAEKANVLPQDIRWHFIGGLQSNKAKVLAAVPNLYAVQSVDSVKLAHGLEKALARPENEARRSAPLYVYLQVNTSGEEGKSGAPPLRADGDSTLLELAKTVIMQCPHLRVRGLMTIGSMANSQESKTADRADNPDFATLKASRASLLTALRADDMLRAKLDALKLWSPDGPKTKTDGYQALFESDSNDALALSMGMSADLESAVQYGTAQVRIGSDCFGARTTNSDASEVRSKELEQIAATPLVKEVVFHPKNMPWFVSDASVHDIYHTVDMLQKADFFEHSEGVEPKQINAVQEMGARWKKHLAEGRFRSAIPLDTPLGASDGPDDFWTLPFGYGAMVRSQRDSNELTQQPAEAPELTQTLASSGLVIFKGDLNYRKLTQDAQWPPTTTFSETLGELNRKMNILALRTCKAEVCVGLAEGQESELTERDPKWRTNGHWAGKFAPLRTKLTYSDAVRAAQLGNYATGEISEPGQLQRGAPHHVML